MKRSTLLVGLVAVVLACILTVACSTITPAQQSALTTQIAAADTQAANIEAQIDQQIAAQVASTQTGTPTPAAITAEAKNVAVLQTAKKTVADARAVAAGVAPIIVNAAAGNDPGPAITAAAPLAGPYAVYVALAGMLVSLGFGVYKQITGANTAAAAQTAVDGIQTAIANGQLVVTSTQAAATVDAVANSHPTNDRLVDVLAAAPVVAIPTVSVNQNLAPKAT